MYYRGAAAALLVFDIASEESFNKVKDWVKGKYLVKQFFFL
jgi:hypothetical protein